VAWTVRNHDEFDPEYENLPEAVRDEILALLPLLQEYGPAFGRPHVDTLNDSKHANLKELRFNAADGVWRVAFAFDPERTAILLLAGDKSGQSEKRFYKALIAKADKRYDAHLAQLRAKAETKAKEKKHGKKSR
jgi:hypothetical protein